MAPAKVETERSKQMIPRETLIAQHTYYTTNRKQAVEAFKKAEADVNAFNGAIEVLVNLLELLSNSF